jgi:lipopolysaccharide export system permease protein
VYIWWHDGSRRRIIRARTATQWIDSATAEQVIEFRDGQYYDIDAATGSCRVTSFQRLRRRISPTSGNAVLKLKALSTPRLAASTRPADIAELQWRLSTGVTTLLLSLLGVPLSRTVPRRGKHARVITAFIIFFIYYHIQLVARSWVEQQVIPPVPGIWWAPFLLACLVTGWLALRLWTVLLRPPTNIN